MADWQSRIRAASFRGFAFEVRGNEIDFGRRTAVHGFPARDVDDVDDLGRRSTQVAVAAFLVGPDHDTRANDFQDLLESGVAGELVHPYRGRLFVKPMEGKRRDVSTERNVTVFDVLFLEVEETPSAPTTDPADELAAAADATRAAAAADVGAGVTSEGVPEYVRAATVNGLTAASSALRKLRFAQSVELDVSTFGRAVQQLTADAASLVTAPAQLALAVLAAVDAVRATAATSVDSFAAYQTLFDVALPAVAGRSTFAAAASRNQDLVLFALRVGATYGAAQAVVDGTWPSADALAEAEAAVLDQVDALEGAADRATFDALEALRASFVVALQATAARVQTRRTVTLARSRPALVVAYSLFDDATRTPDVLAAARVVDPLFVPGGVPFTVAVRA